MHVLFTQFEIHVKTASTQKKKKSLKKKINKMLSKINYVIRKFKRIKHVINWEEDTIKFWKKKKEA